MKKQDIDERKSTPSLHSFSSSEVSDVSSADSESVHERSTPKLAAVIIAVFFLLAAVAGVTVYLLVDSNILVSESKNNVESLATSTVAIENAATIGESLLQDKDQLGPEISSTPEVQKFDFYDENLFVTTMSSDVSSLSFDSIDDSNEGEIEISFFEDGHLLEPDLKKSRPRNQKKFATLNPVDNFKAYPGRPGYKGFLSTVFDKEPEIPDGLILPEVSSRRIDNFETSGEELELGNVGLFGRINDDYEEKLTITDEELDYIHMADKAAEEFGIKKPEYSPPSKRRGRLPLTTTPATTTTTSSTVSSTTPSAVVYDTENENDFFSEEFDPVLSPKRLIPDHVFKAPDLPIQHHTGQFEMNMRGGPFINTPTENRGQFVRDQEPIPQRSNRRYGPRRPLQRRISQPGAIPDEPIGHPTLDRRPGRPPFHHKGPLPEIPSAERRSGLYAMRRPQNLVSHNTPNPQKTPLRPVAYFSNQPNQHSPESSETYEKPIRELQVSNQPISDEPEFRAVASGPPTNQITIQDFQGDDVALPYTDISHLVTLAKEEIEILREIAHNISSEGKDVNLWEMMNAVNASVRQNPNSPVAGLVKRFYQTYMASIEEDLPEQDGLDVETYEKSLSSLIFLSFGIFLLNSVNDIKAKKHGLAKTFADNPSGRSLRALMSDRPEILQLFTSDGSRKLDQPAGNSNVINNYLRLVMNLMKIYARSDSEEMDCVWAAYCHQLNLQAAPGGISSTVARINSVGMRIALRQIESSDAVPAVLKSLLLWQDLPCNKMFPTCATNLEEE